MIADNYDLAVTLGAQVGIVTVAIHSLVDFGLHVTINAVLFTALISITLIKIKSNSAETVK